MGTFVALAPGPGHMYSVHMKAVTPTQARRQWFRLLDEVAAGEIVVIERKGRRIVLRREESTQLAEAPSSDDYRHLIRVPDLERAEEWGWDWEDASADLAVRETPPERSD